MSTSPAEQAPAAGPLLEVSGLVTRYPIPRSLYETLRRREQLHVHAVEGVDFSVEPGEMLALVGESGCGKTTTAQTVMRMVDSDAGQINFRGRDISHLSHKELRPLRREMQIIYQDPYESLDPRYRVRDTVAEPLQIHGIGSSRSERDALVVQALVQAGLQPPELYLDRFPHELSGGQRQRVAIAAAMVLKPKLLLADEPVSMLDVSVRAGILRLLDDLRRDGLAIVMITHDLSTAAHFADRIAVMYLGRIVEEGPATRRRPKPASPLHEGADLGRPQARPARLDPSRVILTGETPNPVFIPSGCRFHPRCPIAQESCRSIDPELRRPSSATSPEHRVACILA